MIPPALGVWHVALSIPDDRFEAAVSFYREGLGMHVAWQPDPDNVYLTSGRDNLALHRVRAGHRVLHEASPLDHLGYVVPTSDSVRAWHERLSKRTHEFGITILTAVEQHRDGATSFYVRDPAGNKLQIVHLPELSSEVGE